MQINWANEFRNLDYYSAEEEYQEKIKELVGCVQRSVRQALESMKAFADADLGALFPPEPEPEHASDP